MSDLMQTMLLNIDQTRSMKSERDFEPFLLVQGWGCWTGDRWSDHNQFTQSNYSTEYIRQVRNDVGLDAKDATKYWPN